MSPFLAEFLGTTLLVLFGDGVVGGWIVISAGWAWGVTIAVYAVNALSGAHLNPAVTIALASIGKFEWSRVPAYILAQTAGALLPIAGKGTSDWGYAWVPVIGPIIGGVVGAWIDVALWTA